MVTENNSVYALFRPDVLQPTLLRVPIGTRTLPTLERGVLMLVVTVMRRSVPGSIYAYLDNTLQH